MAGVDERLIRKDPNKTGVSDEERKTEEYLRKIKIADARVRERQLRGQNEIKNTLPPKAPSAQLVRGGGPQGAALRQAANVAKEQGGSMVTGNLLKAAWLNIITSFGLTFIWIEIHAFLSAIPALSNYFKPFGHEWIPPGVSKLGEKAEKEVATGPAIADWIVFSGCNGCCLFIVFIILVIVYAITHPAEFGISIAK